MRDGRLAGQALEHVMSELKWATLITLTKASSVRCGPKNRGSIVANGCCNHLLDSGSPSSHNPYHHHSARHVKLPARGGSHCQQGYQLKSTTVLLY